MTIDDLVQAAYKKAQEQGFYEKKENQSISSLLMHVISALSKAQEAERQGNRVRIPHCFAEFEKETIKDTFESEIAKTFIRLAGLCRHLHIDIESFVNAYL